MDARLGYNTVTEVIRGRASKIDGYLITAAYQKGRGNSDSARLWESEAAKEARILAEYAKGLRAMCKRMKNPIAKAALNGFVDMIDTAIKQTGVKIEGQ